MEGKRREFENSNKGVRVVRSKKEVMKEELAKKRNIINNIRAREEEARKEKEREEMERMYMEGNDMNIASENF